MEGKSQEGKAEMSDTTQPRVEQWMQDAIPIAEKLKTFIRKNVVFGQCKILSQGDACECQICNVDRLLAIIARHAPKEPEAGKSHGLVKPSENRAPDGVTVSNARTLRTGPEVPTENMGCACPAASDAIVPAKEPSAARGDVITRLRTIREDVFTMANSFAGDKTGDIAITLHGACNAMGRALISIEIALDRAAQGKGAKP